MVYRLINYIHRISCNDTSKHDLKTVTNGPLERDLKTNKTPYSLDDNDYLFMVNINLTKNHRHEI